MTFSIPKIDESQEEFLEKDALQVFWFRVFGQQGNTLKVKEYG